MADLPRKLFAAEAGASALVLLCYLWSWVASDAKRRGGPHWVYFTIERLADARDVGSRAVESALKELETAGLIRRGRHEGNFGAWLLTPPGCEDPNQAADQSIEFVLANTDRRLADRRGGDATGTISIGDRRSNDRRSPGSSMQDRSEIPDHSCRDLRSIASRSPIDLAPCKEEQGVKQGGSKESIDAARRDLGPAIGLTAAAAADLLDRSAARELLTELGPELGRLGLRLPTAGRALDLLASLLAVPGDHAARVEQRLHVRRTVLAFAQVCVVHDPGQRRFWVAEMFCRDAREGGKARWTAIELTVDRWERRLEAATQAETEQARRREEAAAGAAAVVQSQIAKPEVQVELAASAGNKFGRWLAEDVARRSRPSSDLSAPLGVARAGLSTDVQRPLSREEIIARRIRLSDQITAAQADQNMLLARELSQARLELSRQLLALDQAPFGAVQREERHA